MSTAAMHCLVLVAEFMHCTHFEDALDILLNIGNGMKSVVPANPAMRCAEVEVCSGYNVFVFGRKEVLWHLLYLFFPNVV